MARKGLTKRQRLLLLEAARRYLKFEKRDGKSLADAWAGLGLWSSYKPAYEGGFMVPIGGRITKRITMWWLLTPTGAAVVKMLISTMTLQSIEAELEF